MIVLISDAAEAGLEAIGDWIAEANPMRALSFVMELRRRREALSDVPRGSREFRVMNISAFAGEC